jgi:magnesium transporter
MLKMAGVAGARVAADAPPLGSIRRRIPGLFPAFVAGLLGIAVVSSYEDDLRRVLALACFMPMIMGMAKTIGTQSSTLITRGLALGKFEFAVMGRVVFKEMLIGVVAGVVYGSVSGLLAAAYFEHGIRDSWFFGLTIGSAVVTSMTVAAILGATIPLLFERVGWDPASANSPFVSTTIDVTAIWIYLMTGSVLTLL